MLRTRLINSAALMLLALGTGCSSDSSTAPQTAHVDLGQALAELSLPVVSGLVRGFAPVDVGSVGMPGPSTCVYTAASQSFVCPTASASGLTVTHSYVLLNSAGTPQSQFDQNTTAAIRTNMSLAGTIVDPTMTLKIDQQQQLTLSGLLTGTHMINGLSIMKMNGTSRKASGAGLDTLAMTTTTTTAQLAVPSSATAYPASGTMTLDMVINAGGGLGTSTLRMVMTFNGTSKVSVTMTDSGITQRCTLDLASATPVCS